MLSTIAVSNIRRAMRVAAHYHLQAHRRAQALGLVSIGRTATSVDLGRAFTILFEARLVEAAGKRAKATMQSGLDAILPHVRLPGAVHEQDSVEAERIVAAYP